MTDAKRTLAKLLADKLRIERERGITTPEKPVTVATLQAAYNKKIKPHVSIDEIDDALAILEYKKLVQRTDNGVYWILLHELPEIIMMCRLLGGEAL